MNAVRHRDSNMELLRITAMLLVVLFHIDFINFNFPENQLDIFNQPIPAFLKIWGLCATYTCVDVFILLSGWYGIHPKKNHFFGFIFQVLFYSSISYALFLIFDENVKFSWKFVIHILITDDYWFIPIYIILYFFAPVLNYFAENASKRQFALTVIACLILQSMYGWISPKEMGFLEGRSPFSFFILYLLARYIHLYAEHLRNLNKKQCSMLFVLTVSITASIAFVGYLKGISYVIDTIFKFSSLLTIAASVLFVVFFYQSKIRYNRFINWVGKSCFSVFLIHCFPYFSDCVFHPVIMNLYQRFNGMTFAVSVALFVILIYVLSILIDQVRILIWDAAYNLYSKRKSE